ncbi:MAG: mitochondrial 2-enoyl thioester reductase [Cirrosporium novae-zelandiae]|nr:MAG: mitochondrial 2-enoyl thioester reductase [Cirrosporium novae-zelandiae]
MSRTALKSSGSLLRPLTTTPLTNNAPLARSAFSKHARITLPFDRPRSLYGYTQAKALVYTKHGEPKDVLQLHNHSLSPPHSHLVTLKTLAAPLNPADINQIQGVYPSLPPFTTSLGTAQPSAIPGNEMLAEVVNVGGSVSTLKPGDWVVPARSGLGTWRTHLQVDEGDVLKVSSKKDQEQGGKTPSKIELSMATVNPITAYRLLQDFTALSPGDWVLQNGANSAVGRCVIQLARKWGFKTINIIRDRADADALAALKSDLQSLGADIVVEDSKLENSKVWKPLLKDAVGGNGGNMPKLGLNCVHGKPALGVLKSLAPGSPFVTYGAMSKQPLPLPAGLLIFKNYNVTGFWVSKWGAENPEEKKKTVAEVVEMMRSGELSLGEMIEECAWGWKTKEEDLRDTVQGTLEGFRKGKGVFSFNVDM